MFKKIALLGTSSLLMLSMVVPVFASEMGGNYHGGLRLPDISANVNYADIKNTALTTANTGGNVQGTVLTVQPEVSLKGVGGEHDYHGTGGTQKNSQELSMVTGNATATTNICVDANHILAPSSENSQTYKNTRGRHDRYTNNTKVGVNANVAFVDNAAATQADTGFNVQVPSSQQNAPVQLGRKSRGDRNGSSNVSKTYLTTGNAVATSNLSTSVNYISVELE